MVANSNVKFILNLKNIKFTVYLNNFKCFHVFLNNRYNKWK